MATVQQQQQQQQQQQTTQLEFHQAMADFKTMFPDMDNDVIEAVLRSNQGAVDATIDQLLAMSTDNENEKIRLELEEVDDPNADASLSPAAKHVTTSSGMSTPKMKKNEEPSGSVRLTESPGAAAAGGGGGGSAAAVAASAVDGAASNQAGCIESASGGVGVGEGVSRTADSAPSSVSNSSTPLRHQRGWAPPLLGQLPDDFLRLALVPELPSSLPTKPSEGELEDERIALFLQNEEFMAELRWNKDFLLMLDKDSPPEERLTNFPHSRTSDEDAIFKERLRNMGKMSRKKFSQLARVFTGRKKRSSAKTILNQGPAPSRDNLLLQEDDSDGL